MICLLLLPNIGANSQFLSRKKLQKAYGPLRGVKQNAITPPTNPHPYHAGVVKYMKEVGNWSAANEKQQQAALAAAK
mgnify:CR=1 FL=1